MRIEVRSGDFPLTNALRKHVERRLNFALSKHHSQIREIVVSLSDINGPRGGKDKCCQLRIVCTGHPLTIVEDTQADLYVAIDRAAGRVGRVISRKLARSRSHKRRLSPSGQWHAAGDNGSYSYSTL